MGNKGSNTTTTTQAPNPAAMSAYNNLINSAQQIGSTPYTPYTGQLTAGINGQQTLGIGNINQNAGFALPYIQQAAYYANNAAQPLSASTINSYMSPYTNNVINATEAQFANTNAQQQNQLVGNAAASGALGGDRLGVAQGVLAGQQQLAEAPTIAGLENTGYQNAVQLAMAQQQQQANAAYSLGNLGVAGQNAALSGAGAQFGVGTAEQQTQQNYLNALYQQFQIQQAFPYQQLGWEAGIDTGVGSQMGGTGTTTAPPPNPYSQVAGLGIAALGAFAKHGGRINRKVAGFADGGGASGMPGSPYGGAPGYISGVAGYIPSLSITPGRGAPPPPQLPGQQQPDFLKQGFSAYGQEAKRPGGLGQSLGESLNLGDYIPGFFPDLGGEAANGGRIAGFADGGTPYDTFDDRFGSWSPVPPDQAATLHSGVDGYVPSAAPMPQAHPRDVSGRGFAGLPPAFSRMDSASDLPADALGYDQAGSRRQAGFDPTLDDLSVDRSVSGANPTSLAPPAASGFSGIPHLGLLNLSDNARGALISAGLGMMASRSPFLGVGIGQGGLQGFQTFLSERQQDVANQQKQQSLDRQVDQLNELAKYHQKQLQNETEKIGLSRQRIEQDAWKPVTDQYGNIRLFNAKTGEFRDAPARPLPGGTSAPTTGGESTGTVAAGAGDRPYLGESATTDTMEAANRQGLHGQAMLDAIPPEMRNTFDAIANYDAPMSSFSQFRGMPRYRALNIVRAINPDYDEKFYNVQGRAYNNFFAGTSPQSPNVLSRGYNTAIGHAGELAESIRDLQTSDPGIFDEARKAGVPFLSYLAASAQQRIARGTPQGEAWARINAVLPLYAAETAKFYSGSAGTQEERNAIQAPFNPNLSYQEIMGALHQQKEMFKSKTAPLEQEYQDVMDAPGLKQYGTKQNVKQWHVARENAVKADSTIDRIYNEARGPQQPTIPQRPASVPMGSQYSPSRKQWRDPGGKFYDATGNAVQ